MRALGYTTEEMLALFFETNNFHFEKDTIVLELVARTIDEVKQLYLILSLPKVKSSLKQEEESQPQHIRQMEEMGLSKIAVSNDYVIGKTLAHDIIDKESGEIIIQANTEITTEILQTLQNSTIKSFKALYTNDLDHGPYFSDTLRLDPTKSQLEALVEIYRMMRPGEPPTKEAAEQLFQNLFFVPERYDLSPVGRMKFNRRVGRQQITGPGTLIKRGYCGCTKSVD